MPKATSETKRLKLLSDLNLTSPRVRKVLKNLCDMAITITGAEAGDISLVGQHTVQLYGTHTEDVMELPREKSVTDVVISNPNAHYWFEDLRHDARFEASLWREAPYHLCAAAAAPLQVRDCVIGALWVAWKTPQPFDAGRNSALIELANLLSDNLELHAFSTQNESIISELRGEKALHEAMIVQSNVAMAMFDDRMRCLKVSPRWIEEFGPADRKCIGRSIYDLIPSSRRFMDLHTHLLTSGESHQARETQVETAPRTFAYYDWSAVPWRLPEGQIGGLILASNNVTDRVQARVELEIDRARLDLAVRISKMTVFEYDYLTGELKTLSGTPWWGDVPTMPIEKFKAFWLSRIAPEFQVEALAAWHLHEETGVPINIEYRRNSPGDTPEWVQLGAAIVRDPQGNPMRIIGVFRDETEEKRTLDALNDAHHSLDAHMDHHADHLVELSKSLRSSHASVNHMADALSSTVSDDQREEIAQLLDASASAMVSALTALREVGQTLPGDRSEAKDPFGLSPFLPLPPALRVLVAEDNPLSQEVVDQVFGSAGVHRLVVDNGQDALDAFEDNLYQLVLLDLHMPICDGFEACRALRVFEAQFGRRPARIVIMTSDTTSGLAEQAFEAGADEFLQKPLNARQILEQASLAAQSLKAAYSTTQVA